MRDAYKISLGKHKGRDNLGDKAQTRGLKLILQNSK
jgi:hypothetical protein